MRNFGFIESGKSPKDLICGAVPNVGKLPDKYLIADIAKVFDQGSHGSCVSCAAMEMLHFKEMQKGMSENKNIDFEWCYDRRADKTVEGMTPREAFDLLRHANKIDTFARIGSLDILKQTIVAHGPALIALPVKSYDTDFWSGSDFYGGHAVAVVGYNETGLIIKNSWGWSYGTQGQACLPYAQFDKIYEAWTIVC